MDCKLASLTCRKYWPVVKWERKKATWCRHYWILHSKQNDFICISIFCWQNLQSLFRFCPLNLNMESNTHVKCFGCKKTPRSKIYLCLTDCSICDKCYEKSEQIINRSNGVLIRNICPHCSCPFALRPKRNLKEEKNIESLGLSFPCNYQVRQMYFFKIIFKHF